MLDHRSPGVPDTGTILDESFWLFRRNFTLFVAISAIMLVPYMALQLGLNALNSGAPPQSPDSLIEFLRETVGALAQPEQRQGLLGWLYMLVCQPLAAAAIVLAITDRYAQRDVDAQTSIAAALPYLIPLSLAQILLGLILFAVTLPAIICVGLVLNMWTSQVFSQIFDPNVTPGVTTPMILTGLVGLALLLLPLFVNLRLAFVSQVVVLEQLGPAKSIARSWELSSGYGWRLLRIGIATILLQLIVIKLPAAILSQFIAIATAGSELGWMIGSIITRISDVVVFPFSIIVYTLLFYSLCLRSARDESGQSTHQRPLALPGDTAAFDATYRAPSA